MILNVKIVAFVGTVEFLLGKLKRFYNLCRQFGGFFGLFTGYPQFFFRLLKCFVLLTKSLDYLLIIFFVRIEIATVEFTRYCITPYPRNIFAEVLQSPRLLSQSPKCVFHA